MTTQLDIFTDYSRDDQAAVLALIVSDPLHARDKEAIIEAIRVSVRPDGLVNSNDWRPNMPASVYHKMIGPTVNSLCAEGRMVKTELLEKSTDRAGRNSGRWMSVYRWVGVR